ncbi:MAG TPA: hypothetical protein VJT72_17065 [Pseudonocardiaceae bacterium]|nr:hypothetical protein [Pseudonocardiaceae bacterium]
MSTVNSHLLRRWLTRSFVTMLCIVSSLGYIGLSAASAAPGLAMSWPVANFLSAIFDPQNNLAVFARDTNSGELKGRWGIVASDGSSYWGPSISGFGAGAGGVFAGYPRVGQNADGRIEVYVVNESGVLLQKVQVSPNCRSSVDSDCWTPWRPFSTGLPAILVHSPTVARNADGRLEVLAVTRDDSRIWRRWQITPNGPWSAWTDFGAAAGRQPSIGVNDDGRLDVVALQPGGVAIWHRQQITPGGGWTGWQEIGGPARQVSPAVGRDQLGRLTIVALSNVDLSVWARTQIAANSATWGAWRQIDGPIYSTAPGVTTNPNTTKLQDVFTIRPDRTVWWNSLIGSAWTQLWPSPNLAVYSVSQTPTIVARSDGTTILFSYDNYGRYIMNVHLAGGGWRGWYQYYLG